MKERFMKIRQQVLILTASIIICGGLLFFSNKPDTAVAQENQLTSISGTALDAQDQPVNEAEVSLYINDSNEPLATGPTHSDGTFILEYTLDEQIDSLKLSIDHPHFAAFEWEAGPEWVADINHEESIHIPTFVLERRVTAAFWIATGTFVAVLALIAFEKLHNTLAALMGVCIVLATSAIGKIDERLFIFDFEHALNFVDFEVIFLVMGMMIVIAAIEDTGIFQWMTYQAYRLSRGQVWLLVTILMCITAVASALLDNVTTMLLMTPLTIQIALALGVNPRSLIIPEVLASNVGGITTLIGTPTNILIGAYAGLGFNDFLVNLTPGVLMAQAALIGYVLLRYRKGWKESGPGGISEALLERLAEAGQIKQPKELLKAGIIFGLMLVGFVLGEQIHLPPAVIAIAGAVLILLWVAPEIEAMMQSVDWTTLMFFIALFILVGAIQEVGLLSIIASGISKLVGDSLVIAVLVLIWAAAMLSGVIANIPFTAAMLPVVDFLSRTVPGAGSSVLFYSLSVGSAMGGNSSLIGASANMVTAGIAERAGYRITYMDFLKAGLPATILTVAIGMGWLFIRFGVFR